MEEELMWLHQTFPTQPLPQHQNASKEEQDVRRVEGMSSFPVSHGNNKDDPNENKQQHLFLACCFLEASHHHLCLPEV
jgi:hypothetical protein